MKYIKYTMKRIKGVAPYNADSSPAFVLVTIEKMQEGNIARRE